MKQIKIADTTLCAEEGVFGFKEKLEIARQLDNLKVDVVELPQPENSKADLLFIRTASALLKNSILSVAAGKTEQSVLDVISALSTSPKGRIRIELPMSPVGMEYLAKKKPAAMLEWVGKAISMAKGKVSQVEFCALDATRAEKAFLKKAIDIAVESGATHLSLCDCAGKMLPDDVSAFVLEMTENVTIPVGIRCSNQNGLAAAASVLAVRGRAVCIKTDIDGQFAPLLDVASMIKTCGENYGFSARINQTELYRIVKQINWVMGNAKEEKSAMTVSSAFDTEIKLAANDDRETVLSAVSKLGYDLSEEDGKKVYEEFQRVAAKKNVGEKELDAIVASAAMQVPSTFRLANYVVNSGNIISASAQITLEKGESVLQGVCIGDGPVDAAFRAIDQIIGYHYELDDFQIQAVTEGKEAMGSAVVKLRADGKVYSGNGISTDIIGASIRAYLNAVNKIVYEEE